MELGVKWHEILVSGLRLGKAHCGRRTQINDSNPELLRYYVIIVQNIICLT